MERQIMVCECHSLEHQVTFWYDEEDSLLYNEINLTTHRNFFKRLWYGLKYAFGYNSRYGAWDSTIFKPEDLLKLNKHLCDMYPRPQDEKIVNMSICMLSILDYLKLQDNCKDKEEMLRLNDETLSEMMFRKMEVYNVDLNKELGFTHLKPVKKHK